MRKEIIFAVLLGLILGLVITYGVYRARTSLQDGTNPAASPEATVSPDIAAQSNLVLSSPQDESVQETEEVTIAGTTDPDAFVVIVLNDNETITQADDSGNFSVEETLEEGANVILVFSVNEDGQTVTQERTVIYTTDSLEETEDDDQAEAEETDTEETSDAPAKDEEESDDDA